MNPAERCPCESGDSYGECCGPVHAGTRAAPTAEALMRSRYSAFALGDVGYLLRSWHASTRPDELELDTEIEWTSLSIISTSRGGPFDSTGTVEFVARHSSPSGRGSQHEFSSFVREDREWFYLAAED